MSINSMYQWYKKADLCFAYLFDYPSKEVASTRTLLRSKNQKKIKVKKP